MQHHARATVAVVSGMKRRCPYVLQHLPTPTTTLVRRKTTTTTSTTISTTPCPRVAMAWAPLAPQAHPWGVCARTPSIWMGAAPPISTLQTLPIHPRMVSLSTRSARQFLWKPSSWWMRRLWMALSVDSRPIRRGLYEWVMSLPQYQNNAHSMSRLNITNCRGYLDGAEWDINVTRMSVRKIKSLFLLHNRTDIWCRIALQKTPHICMSRHMWMSHVTHMNESCHEYKNMM